jgi:PAS domain S-box-containing protein
MNLSRHVTAVISHFTASKEGYRRLVDELEDFLHAISPAGTLLYTSPSSRKHLGLDPKLVEGKSLLDFIHQDDHSTVMKHLQKALTERKEYAFYCRYKKATGDMLLMEVKGRAFPEDPNVGPVQFVLHAAREYRYCFWILNEMTNIDVLIAQQLCRSKGTLSIDSILELRLENLRLRRKLEDELAHRYGFYE